jgi:hypothetical protein
MMGERKGERNAVLLKGRAHLLITRESLNVYFKTWQAFRIYPDLVISIA